MKKNKKVLIADDSDINRNLLADILGGGYQYYYAENGKQVIELLNNGLDVDIILLDINMPLMDGFEVLKVMHDRHWLEETPVVVISAEDDAEFLIKAYNLGATDYISRPFSVVTVQFRVENTLMLYSNQRQLIQLIETQMLEREEINNALINIFSHTVGLRNNESGKHSLNIRRVSDLLLHRLVTITDRYPMTEKTISVITSLSALHDIGKIAIPTEILNKPGKLTPEEWTVMKTHAEQGDEIITTAAISQNSFVVKIAREICRSHHERWDGNGYPDELVGDEIPISAQVVSIADVYDALTSERCYKEAYSSQKAIDMICNGECGMFNPILIQCLKDITPMLNAESDEYYIEKNSKVNALVLTYEALRNNELPLDNRSRRLFMLERKKKDFFKSLLGGIQFEYDCPTQNLTYINRYKKDGQITAKYIAGYEDIDLLSKSDRITLIGKIQELTRENTDLTMNVKIPINNVYYTHRLTLRAIWPSRGDNYICIIGQFTNIDDNTPKLEPSEI